MGWSRPCHLRKTTIPTLPAVALLPFQEGDAEFFAAKASDELVTHFIGDGRPWGQQLIDDRVRAALRHDPLNLVGAARWFVATEETKPVGIVSPRARVMESRSVTGFLQPIGDAASPGR